MKKKRRKNKLSKTGRPQELQFEFIEDYVYEETPEEKAYNEALSQYRQKVKTWLMEDAWKYSEEIAEDIVSYEYFRIKEGFDNNESPQDVGIDIGYFAG